MALPRTEDFTGSAGDLTSGEGWFQQDATAKVQRNGSGLGTVGGSSADAYAVDTQNSYSNDQYSKMVVHALDPGAAYCQVMTRGSITDKSGYALYTDGTAGAGHTAIQLWVAGSASAVGEVNTTFADGDVLELRSVGSVHSVYKNSIFVVSYTDATIASGAAGMGGVGTSTSPTFDNWEGGNVGAAAFPGDDGEWPQSARLKQNNEYTWTIWS